MSRRPPMGWIALAGMVFTGTSYATAPDTPTQVVSVAAKELYVESWWMSVEVQMATGSQIEIEHSREPNALVLTRINEEARVRQIERSPEGVSSHCPKESTGKIQVRIPANTRLFIDSQCAEVTLLSPRHLPSVFVVTATGDIEVHGAEHLGLVQLDSVLGDIRFDGRASRLELNTVSGQLLVQSEKPISQVRANAASGSVTLLAPIQRAQIRTTSGHIVARQMLGSTEMESVSGNISVQWQNFPKRSNNTLQSEQGSIEALLPKGSSPQGRIFQGSQDVKSDFDIQQGNPQSPELQLVGNGGKLSLESGSGSIRLRQISPIQMPAVAPGTHRPYAAFDPNLYQ